MMSRSYGNGYAKGSNSGPSAPGRIKCSTCGIVKPSNNFSTKQLEKLQKHMRGNPKFNAEKMAYIECTSDTSQQVTELYCQHHEKWMGLDKFFKVQRKTPDNAYCIECVKARVEMEPDREGDDDDSGDSHGSFQCVSGSSDDDDDHNIQGATSSLGGLSVSNGQSTTYPSQNGASSAGGGVSLAKGSTAPTSFRSGSTKAGSDAGTASTMRTAGPAFDRNKYSNPADSTTTKSRGGAWAKIPAGPVKPLVKKVDSDDSADDFRVSGGSGSDEE